VLGTPPAFILSQDQTRHSDLCANLTTEIYVLLHDKLIKILDRFVVSYFLTTLQLFRYPLDAFASGALSSFLSGASEMISLTSYSVKRFFYEFSKIAKTHFFNVLIEAVRGASAQDDL
jgi:hypothetical protein